MDGFVLALESHCLEIISRSTSVRRSIPAPCGLRPRKRAEKARVQASRRLCGCEEGAPFLLINENFQLVAIHLFIPLSDERALGWGYTQVFLVLVFRGLTNIAAPIGIRQLLR